MNKRIISALVLAGMVATSAFASDARNLVMGTGGASSYSNGGSFYYEDAYNFFYNPAYVNDYKNWAIFEKGTNGAGGASFGFVSSMMNFNMGLFFNRNATLTGGSASALDFMIGGDAGVKWGLGLTYGSAGGSGTTNSSNLAARLGLAMNGFDPFVTFQIIGKDRANGSDTNKYTSLGGGLRYHYGEWTPYFAVKQNKTEVLAVAPATGSDTKISTWTIGLGREAKLAEGARLAYAIYFNRMVIDPSSAGTPTTTSSQVPLDMAIEADALSWLTLRGGVNHVLVAGNGVTTTRVGGTFHVSKVDLDYAFGNENAAGTVSADSANIGFDSGTFHRVAMRYSW